MAALLGLIRRYKYHRALLCRTLCLCCLLALLCGCAPSPYPMRLGTEQDGLILFSGLQVDAARYSSQFGTGQGGRGMLLGLCSLAEAEAALNASLAENGCVAVCRSSGTAGSAAFWLCTDSGAPAYVSLRAGEDAVSCCMGWQRLPVAGRADRTDLFAALPVPRHLLPGDPQRLSWTEPLALEPLQCQSGGSVDTLDTQQAWSSAFLDFYLSCGCDAEADGDTLRVRCPAEGLILCWTFSTAGSRVYVRVQLEPLAQAAG